MADVVLIDPLGRRITLKERTWVGHVLTAHADMADHRRLAEEAIRKPEEIRQSTVYPGCRAYYGTGPEEGLMIACIADVELGIVKTIHLCRRKRPGATEWP